MNRLEPRLRQGNPLAKAWRLVPTLCVHARICDMYQKQVSEYEQEMPQSHTADQLMVP